MVPKDGPFRPNAKVTDTHAYRPSIHPSNLHGGPTLCPITGPRPGTCTVLLCINFISMLQLNSNGNRTWQKTLLRYDTKFSPPIVHMKRKSPPRYNRNRKCPYFIPRNAINDHWPLDISLLRSRGPWTAGALSCSVRNLSVRSATTNTANAVVPV